MDEFLFCQTLLLDEFLFSITVSTVALISIAPSFTLPPVYTRVNMCTLAFL